MKNNPFGKDKVPGFDESLQKAWTDIKNAPIGQSLAKITFPTGEAVRFRVLNCSARV
ncbi:hypothetical protein [Pseudomonas aeruginosa]|uniref:hypothetical protein n=1 Tax=Pseudomonas aeruginosa TaxID=287 RepID=UPI0015A540CB|nr:hypothetical protein [Pseudomonas aeruginosa]